eukprot:7138841-Prorocentrum_lima.AAC.1
MEGLHRQDHGPSLHPVNMSRITPWIMEYPKMWSYPQHKGGPLSGAFKTGLASAMQDSLQD